MTKHELIKEILDTDKKVKANQTRIKNQKKHIAFLVSELSKIKEFNFSDLQAILSEINF